MTPKQSGIAVTMQLIKDALANIDDTIHNYTEYKRPGAAIRRGIRKEMTLIHNRLGNRLPKGTDWEELPLE